jgi:hypothetical protein
LIHINVGQVSEAERLGAVRQAGSIGSMVVQLAIVALFRPFSCYGLGDVLGDERYTRNNI